MLTRITSRRLGYSIFTAAYYPERGGADMPASLLARDVPCFRETNTLHCHEDHEVLLIERGAGDCLLADGERIPVSAMQLCVFPSGVLHAIRATEPLTLKGFMLHPDRCAALLAAQVAPDFARQLARIATDALPVRILQHFSLYQRLSDLFDQTVLELGTCDPWQSPALTLLGSTVAIALARALEAGDTTDAIDSAEHRVARVYAWMDRHYLEPVTHAALAEMAHLSPSQFHLLFRTRYGTTPKGRLQQLRLNQAAHLLHETTLPIAVIAHHIGFSDGTTFRRAFVQQFGIPPTRYRQMEQDKSDGSENPPAA